MSIALLTALPGAALAETLTCQVAADCAETVCATTPIQVVFEIDRTQFAPAQHSGDPPRQQITQVTMGAARFPAEPMLMANGTIRGFWGNDPSGAETMMIVQPDLTAVLSKASTGQRLTGTCEVS